MHVDPNGMNAPAGVASRLERLSAHLTAVRRSNTIGYRQFFAALGARIDYARALEGELDRKLARKFNALDYVRTDELGLSRIVADLLDPKGAHGQGVCFLERFCEMVCPERWLYERIGALGDVEASVLREREIRNKQRLDVSVELRPPGRQPVCIAIENKPYSADAVAQIAGYLEFLRDRYRGRFILIYLSWHGGRPSRESLPETAREDGLATMSYCPPAASEAGDDDALRLRASLTDWLKECRQSCEVERLRWFLGEVETFCHKTFGGTVTTSSERKEVREFILAGDDNVRTAMAVAEAWPETRDEVVGRFLKVLRDRIACSLGAIEDLQAQYGFGLRGQKDGVWLHRTTWTSVGDALPLVRLSHEGGARKWFVGVGLETGNTDVDVEERLKEELRRVMPESGLNSPGWPWYRYLEEHRDWAPLVARLHKESQQPGELVDYFRGRLIEAAEAAVPAIDRVLEKR